MLNGLGLLIFLRSAIYLEVPHDHKPVAGKCELRELNDVEGAETYAKVVTSGYRDVRSRRVTVIAFKENSDPARVLNNVCEQRWYIARLIPLLASNGATAIVFDKFFGPTSCDKDDPATTDFITAVKTSTVPIVAGLASHVPESDPQNACLIVSDSLDFGNKSDANGTPTNQPAMQTGLIRLNSDTRKVPLNWFSYENDEAFNAGREPSDARYGTLSWITATLVDKELKNEPELERLRASGQHPFTSFISPDALSRADALSLLCASPRVRPEIESRYGVNCAEHPATDAEILGRVIVIGEDIPGRDRHTLFGNDVSGVYLQANYIESLLDGRYLRTFGAGWNYTIFVLWVGCLYLLFWIQPEVGLALSLLVGVFARYLIVQLVMWKGIYPQVWVQELGGLFLVLKYIESRGHRIVDAMKERQHDQPLEQPPAEQPPQQQRVGQPPEQTKSGLRSEQPPAA